MEFHLARLVRPFLYPKLQFHSGSMNMAQSSQAYPTAIWGLVQPDCSACALQMPLTDYSPALLPNPAAAEASGDKRQQLSPVHAQVKSYACWYTSAMNEVLLWSQSDDSASISFK